MRVVGVACAPDRQPAAEAIDTLAHQLQLELDVAQEAALFGDLRGEVFVFDTRDVERVARLDSAFSLPPLGAPALYAHAAHIIARD